MHVDLDDFSVASDDELEDEEERMDVKHFQAITAQAAHIFDQIKWSHIGEVTLQMIVDWLFSLPSSLRNVDILEFVVRELKVWTKKHKLTDLVSEAKFISIMDTTEELHTKSRGLLPQDVPDLFDFSNKETDSLPQAREL